MDGDALDGDHVTDGHHMDGDHHHEHDESFTSKKSDEEELIGMIQELIEVFCQSEDDMKMDDMGKRRLDDHGDHSGADLDMLADSLAGEDEKKEDMSPDELCNEARKQLEEAMRFVRADEKEQQEIAEGWANMLGELLSEVLSGSVALYAGAASLSAAVTLMAF